MSQSTDTRNAEQEFAAALAAFQAAMPHIGKNQQADAGSYKYSYSDLADITQVVAPLLAAQGLSWTARPMLTEAGFVLRYGLLHVAGHREGGDYPLPDPAKFSPQQIGSATTYARRYAFTAVTGIAPGGEDDDGQRATDARARDHTPRPAPVDPVVALKKEIVALGDRLDYDLDTLKADFAEKHGGDIGGAGVADLTAYAATLKAQVAELDGPTLSPRQSLPRGAVGVNETTGEVVYPQPMGDEARDLLDVTKAGKGKAGSKKAERGPLDPADDAWSSGAA